MYTMLSKINIYNSTILTIIAHCFRIAAIVVGTLSQFYPLYKQDTNQIFPSLFVLRSLKKTLEATNSINSKLERDNKSLAYLIQRYHGFDLEWWVERRWSRSAWSGGLQSCLNSKLRRHSIISHLVALPSLPQKKHISHREIYH